MEGLINTGHITGLVANLFEGALSQPPERFRSWMLEAVATAASADGALWRRAKRGAGAHALTVWQLPPQFPRAWEGSAEINPLKLHMRQRPDVAESLARSCAPEPVPRTRVYRRVLAQHGVRDAVGVLMVDRVLELNTEIVLTRTSEAPFTDDEIRAFQLIAPAMIGAATQAYFLGLAKPAGTHAHRPSAVVDAGGAVLDAQWGFRSLMQRHFPGWTGHQLPFDVPESLHRSELSVGPLQVYAEHLAELTLLRIWERERLEVLTLREREIADRLVRGASYKVIAQELELSPSTVANHVHRIYGKLGIGRRRQLIDLLTGSAKDAGR